MSTSVIDGRVAAPMSRGAAARPPSGHGSVETSGRIEDRQFEMMEAAFSRTGGCVTASVLAQHVRHRTGQPLSIVAEWITGKVIVSFPWRSQTLVPLFQFRLDDMSPDRGTTDIVRELVDVFDQWELALWIVQPNTWLENAAPIDVIKHDWAAVHRAARADRYIARG